MDNLKQVIIIRRDLNMNKSKMVAQGCHASLAAFLSLKSSKQKELSNSPFAKVTLQAESEEHLIELYYKALKSGLPCSLIRDSGKTYFHGVPTLTAVAIGPASIDDIDKITGTLKLY